MVAVALAQPRVAWMWLDGMLIASTGPVHLGGQRAVVETSLGYFITHCSTAALRFSVARTLPSRNGFRGVVCDGRAVADFHYGSFPWSRCVARRSLLWIIRKLRWGIDPGLASACLYCSCSVGALLWVETQGNGGFVSTWSWQIEPCWCSAARDRFSTDRFSYAGCAFRTAGWDSCSTSHRHATADRGVVSRDLDRARAIGFIFICIACALASRRVAFARKPVCLLSRKDGIGEDDRDAYGQEPPRRHTERGTNVVASPIAVARPGARIQPQQPLVLADHA